jgi:hypothetical protein
MVLLIGANVYADATQRFLYACFVCLIKKGA